VGVLGGLMTWGPASLGAIEYYSQDILNIFYAEAKYGVSFGSGFNAIGAAQFVDQRSTGQNLLTGGNYFATNQFGAKVDLGYQTGILTLGYSVVNPTFAIQTPWSANPFYTDGQIQAFNRAGEQAFMAGLSYIFTPIGLPGVAASVFYFNGSTSAPAAGAPLVGGSGTSISVAAEGWAVAGTGCARYRDQLDLAEQHAHQHRRGAPDRELRHQAY
jgi:hypothetical protein